MESSGLVPMSSRVGLVDWSGLESMSSRLGLGQCRVVWAWADVELSGLGLMSSRPGPDRCRFELVRVQVESA